MPEIPKVCPVLGIELYNGPYKAGTGKHPKDHSPSIDRIIPKLGYVKSNVRIISFRANTLKGNATAAELRAVLVDVERIESEQKASRK